MPGLNQTNAWSVASLQAASQAAGQAAGKAGAQPLFGAANDWDFSFHNLLGIVNPLQHLPVIGTLYRAITGDKIGAPEKIAGDTLYGGLWGAVSSIADTAFEAVTGKDFEDTAMAMLTGGAKKTTAVATNTAPAAASATSAPTASIPAAHVAPAVATAAPTPLTQAATIVSSADIAALTSALQQKGIDSDTAQRALLAYRQTMAPQTSVLAAAQ